MVGGFEDVHVRDAGKQWKLDRLAYIARQQQAKVVIRDQKDQGFVVAVTANDRSGWVENLHPHAIHLEAVSGRQGDTRVNDPIARPVVDLPNWKCNSQKIKPSDMVPMRVR